MGVKQDTEEKKGAVTEIWWQSTNRGEEVMVGCQELGVQEGDNNTAYVSNLMLSVSTVV